MIQNGHAVLDKLLEPLLKNLLIMLKHLDTAQDFD
jgi:hypothetical protein